MNRSTAAVSAAKTGRKIRNKEKDRGVLLRSLLSDGRLKSHLFLHFFEFVLDGGVLGRVRVLLFQLGGGVGDEAAALAEDGLFQRIAGEAAVAGGAGVGGLTGGVIGAKRRIALAAFSCARASAILLWMASRR